MVSTGGLGRNVLGVEWVLPTGDILNMGSIEAGAGWFTADGPGPSFGGIAGPWRSKRRPRHYLEGKREALSLARPSESGVYHGTGEAALVKAHQ